MLAALLPILGTVIQRLFPDPEQAAKAQQEITLALIAQETTLKAAAADIVKAEAQSDHWLAASWRPLTMLTFTALIVARWMGWSAPNISEDELLKLWSIVEFGLGGYVVGRSVEKIAPAIADAIKR